MGRASGFSVAGDTLTALTWSAPPQGSDEDGLCPSKWDDLDGECRTQLIGQDPKYHHKQPKIFF